MAYPPRQRTGLDNARITRLCTAAAAACALLALGATKTARAEDPLEAVACEDWRAELSAIQGIVEIRRTQGSWTRITGAGLLCSGDSVRTGDFSRAVVRLRDDSVIRLDARATLSLSDDGAGSLIELIRGVIHVISRDPRSLRFSTPYANAGIKGTEFDIRVSDSSTEIAVLEGEVVVTNPLGRVEAPSGYVATASAGAQPQTYPIPEPIELMRWASYFAEVLDRELPNPDARPAGGQAADAPFLTSRAAARLRRGNLQAAESDLTEALRLAPGDSEALALRAVAAIGRGDLAGARASAEAATANLPTASALIALSHVQQAEADFAAALASANAALSLEPANAIASARRAEIALALGDRPEALRAAMRAIELDPDLGYARTVLGFVRLAANSLPEAIATFEQAVMRDAGAPLPHIGLALALMQQGDQTAGRRQLEIAVALDPANALTRSYMAKTYDAENRRELPDEQLALARRFDPTDPTPWLYDSLMSLQQNRPVDALNNLLEAIDLNDNRALFRSRLAMDSDLATRSAGTARVLREVGFEQLALVRGWSATALDPTDYAAHRLLADVYSVRPREEISRVSSLLTSQLLQPANLRPIQPQLAQGGPLLVQRAAQRELAFSELAPLVTTNGLRLQASTVGGANNTFGEDVAIGGLRDKVSYSAGQFRYSTDGFGENNDFDQKIANAFVQFNPNDESMIQAELRSSDVERGDLHRYFFDRTREFRAHEEADTLRLGARRDLGSRDTLLFSALTTDNAFRVDGGSNGISDFASDGWGGDVQLIHDGDRWNLRSGVVLAEIDSREAVAGVPPTSRDGTQQSVYAYANIGLTSNLSLTAGGAADRIEDGNLKERGVSPKLGVTWTPSENVTVRFASFETLLGTLTSSKQNPQPRLEPIQVAGFNQFHLGANGDASKFAGLAVDAKLSSKLFAGVELARRDVDGTVEDYEDGSLSVVATQSSEDAARSYVYWIPRGDMSFSAQYSIERQAADQPKYSHFGRYRTHRLPLEARYFSPTGLTAGIRASRLEQRGEFVITSETSEPLAYGADQFWILDASIGYRLPNRRGVLSFNIDNLLDEQFRFQDLDSENPSLMPERMAYLRFTLAFE
ncbi:MAG: TonB-dependent receptor [Polyangiaceae bacterium]